MAAPPIYERTRAAVTVDCAVFGLDEESLKLLLIERAKPPFLGQWALPGGFVRPEESVDAAARRELLEETGLERLYLEQLHTFGEVGRDPRGRVISVAYFALVKLSDHRVRAATDAASASWFPVTSLPRLAFDHAEILAAARERLETRLRRQPVGFELLSPKFTLTQLQRMYEIILERPLDKRNFRRKILAMDLLEELEEFEKDVSRRAARLYRFDRRKYERLEKAGFSFDI